CWRGGGGERGPPLFPATLPPLTPRQRPQERPGLTRGQALAAGPATRQPLSQGQPQRQGIISVGVAVRPSAVERGRGRPRAGSLQKLASRAQPLDGRPTTCGTQHENGDGQGGTGLPTVLRG